MNYKTTKNKSFLLKKHDLLFIFIEKRLKMRIFYTFLKALRFVLFALKLFLKQLYFCEEYKYN
jgi:hypothetical protein